MSVSTFSDLNLHPSIHRGLQDLQFETPTPIQRDSVPPALEGRDILACAATGSGKTAAFLLPILERLLTKPRGTTRALILTPTRELAAQIVEHFHSLAKHTNLRAAAIYGGVGMGPQEQAFRRGVDVMVACPGRLLDHLSRPHGKLDGLEVLVLDEVDRMLDMGFLPDVRRVLRQLPEVDQALFFSATLSKPIADLAHKLLHKPVTLNIERASRPAEGVNQSFWPVAEPLKRSLLLSLIEKGEIADALIFTRTKHRANRLAQFLERRGVPCDRIHGNRSQSQRTRALAAFKEGRIKFLVATDIAARGIDVNELSHVVNFDVPHMSEDYIHRIGRTARAGATGDAFTFMTPEDTQDIRSIERAVGRRIPIRRLEDFDYDLDAAAVRRDNADAPRGNRRPHGRSASKPGSRRGAQNPQRGRGRGRTEERSADGRSGEQRRRPAKGRSSEQDRPARKAQGERSANPGRPAQRSDQPRGNQRSAGSEERFDDGCRPTPARRRQGGEAVAAGTGGRRRRRRRAS